MMADLPNLPTQFREEPLFFDEKLNSADLRKRLVDLLIVHDFDVAKGTLEVFPHPSESSQGLGLRLPLQPGFAWLDKTTLEVEHERSDINATAALELFVDALDGDANSYAAYRGLKAHIEELQERKSRATGPARQTTTDNVVPLRRSIEQRVPGEFADFVKAIFDRLPPGISTDIWYRGRLYHLNGLSAPSQRADAIFSIGHYLFYGDPSRDLPAMGYGYEQEREWAIKEFLSLHHNGHSKDINKGRSDAIAQIERAAHWQPAHRKNTAARKYSNERPIAWIRENANRKSEARERISDALGTLKTRRRSFTTVELQEAAGCSRETLYKHDDIWRKDYEDLAEGFFAICTDEYNAVVGADSSGIQPPATTAFETMPPGRLAARRIAFEISRRSEREKRKQQKTAATAANAFENTWRSNLSRVLEKAALKTSIKDKQALLSVLLSYQALAPTEEALLSIREEISSLRVMLIAAIQSHELQAQPP